MFFDKLTVFGWDLYRTNRICTYWETWVQVSKHINIKSTFWNLRKVRILMRVLGWNFSIQIHIYMCEAVNSVLNRKNQASSHEKIRVWTWSCINVHRIFWKNQINRILIQGLKYFTFQSNPPLQVWIFLTDISMDEAEPVITVKCQFECRFK